jgi:hypothetical protein
MNIMLPCARFEDLVVQELKDEVLVCDLKSNQVFCLNQTAGEVWKLCDGKNNVKTISQILSRKLKADFSDEMVLFSLSELSKHDLLMNKVSNEIIAGLTRREVIKHIGLSSMIALPLISSVVMPKAAQAASVTTCNNDGDCLSGAECCHIANQVCISLSGGSNSIGCACSSCGDCDSNCCFNGVCSNGNACETPVTCGLNVACPPPFICCNPSNPADDSNCSVCGC